MTEGDQHASAATEPLSIEPVGVGDVDFLRSLATDPAVIRHVGDGQPWSEAYLQVRVQEALVGGSVRWFVARDALRRNIGLLSLRRAQGRTEVGYWIAPAHWGRGHAGHLLQRAVDMCRRDGERLVVARVQPGNGASQRVLERGSFLRAEGEGAEAELMFELRL